MPSIQNIINIYNLMEECLKRHLPFVTYRLPGERYAQIVMQTSQEKSLLDENIFANKGFLLFPFPGSKKSPVLIRPDFHIAENRITEEAIVNILTRSHFSPNGYRALVPQPTTQEDFCKGAERMIAEINQGNLRKGVLSRVYLQTLDESFDAIEFYKNLKQEYPSAFVYIAYLPHVGFWIGATPELLLSLEKETLSTAALAGTRKVEMVDPAEWGMKEKKEQKIVSEHIQQCLEKYFGKNIEITGPETVVAGPVQHLKTTFKVKIDQLSTEKNIPDALVKDLHPTPAIAGMPKEAALKLISEIEKHDRGFYTGFLGPVNLNGKSNLFVNLRCMEILENSLALYLGAGITAESDPDREWEETQFKAQTLLDVLNEE